MQKTEVKQILGIDRRLITDKPDRAFDIRNMSYDPKKRSWAKNRGWCAYLAATPSVQTEDVYSLGQFSLKGGAKNYILSEREQSAGSLTLEFIDPRASGGQTTLATGRHVPSQEDWGTTYVPYGSFCLIINGVDAPLKYFGDQRVEPFGFTSIPPQCTPFAPTSMDMGNQATQTYAQQSKTTAGYSLNGITVVVDGGNLNSIGMGNPDVDKSNCYAYAYSWVSDTGSESPLSPATASVKWTSASAHAYRYGIVIDGIARGPEGTLKRRLYRTKNIGDGTLETATFYFLDDIANNVETSYSDFIPDSFLAAEAPSVADTGMLPVGCNVAANFAGRIIIGGGYNHPTRLFYSSSLGPEQFPEANYIDCAQREGDEITGLVPFNNLLIVLRRNSIEALVPTNDATRPFYITPIYSGVGCPAPKTAKVITGAGLAFLGSDGFYMLTGNFSGGSQIKVEVMSDTLSDYFSRINVQAMARAVATYNVRDNEYWCHVPVDGAVTPNLGFIFHAPIESWSVREAVPAQAFVQTPEGWTMFGSNQNLLGNIHPVYGGTWAPVSWGIWCGILMSGYKPGYSTFFAAPQGVISTGWMDMGDSESLKDIKGVIFNVVGTSVSAKPSVKAYRNWNWASEQTTLQYGTNIQDQEQPPCYGVAVYDTATWDNTRLSNVRGDFFIPQIRQVRFELSDSGKDCNLEVVGFSILWDNTTNVQPWTDVFDRSTGQIPKLAGTVPASYLPASGVIL